MAEWKEYPLGEIINLKRGYDLPNQTRSKGDVPVVSSSGIMDYHKEAMVAGPGVITGRYGTIGQVFYVKEDYWPLNTTLYVQDFKGNDERFIYYLLKNFDFEMYSDKSAVPGVNRNHLHTERVTIPPVGEQRVIASILSSLDEKIDMLDRQNQTLEALAETLFRQWFVEEAEAEWKPCKLLSIAEHLKDSINPMRNPDKVFHHYSIPAFDVGREPVSELGKEIRSNKFRVSSNTILVSKLNPKTPRIWMIFGDVDESDSICSTEFQVVQPKRRDHFGFTYCYLKSSAVTNELANAVGGTSGSHQRVDPQVMFDLVLAYPPVDKIVDFDNATKNFWMTISANKGQIRTLIQLRDTLLPKLMSGEVGVNKNNLTVG